MNKNMKPKISKDIVWKKEGKNGELLSLTSWLGGPILLLNPVASKIVILSNGKNTIEQIATNICKSFEDTDLNRITKDLEKFFIVLQDKKIIESFDV